MYYIKYKISHFKGEIMGIKPLLDRVVIAPLQEAETSAGGILLSGSEQEAPTQGKVVAVGPGTRKEDGTFTGVSVEEGQTVLYSKYGVTEVNYDGEDFLVLNETSILGIIE